MSLSPPSSSSSPSSTAMETVKSNNVKMDKPKKMVVVKKGFACAKNRKFDYRKQIQSLKQDRWAREEEIRRLRQALRELQFEPGRFPSKLYFLDGPRTMIRLPPLPPVVAAKGIGLESHIAALDTAVKELTEHRSRVCQERDSAKSKRTQAFDEKLRELDEGREKLEKLQKAELVKFDKALEQLVHERNAECDRFDDYVRGWLEQSNDWIKKAREELAMMRKSPVVAAGGGDDEELHQNLCCPLTQEIMVDPVMTTNGHTYERKAIEMWFTTTDGNPRCPLSNQELASSTLIPNIGIKSLCEVYHRRSGQNVPKGEKDDEIIDIPEA